MARIAEAGTMTVAVKFDVAGFGLTGLSDTPRGFDVEIAKIVASKLGVAADKINWIEGLGNLREQLLESGDADMVVATYTMNDERKKRVSYVGPYYMAGQQLMVATDDDKIDRPEFFANQPTAKVCTNSGSTNATNILKYLANESQLVLFDVISKCGDALRTHQVSAVTGDNTTLLGLVSQSKGLFKMVGIPFTQEPYGIGIPKGDTAFCTFIAETLKEAAKSGDYEKAWKSTGGEISGAATTPALPDLEPCS